MNYCITTSLTKKMFVKVATPKKRKRNPQIKVKSLVKAIFKKADYSKIKNGYLSRKDVLRSMGFFLVMKKRVMKTIVCKNGSERKIYEYGCVSINR